MNPENESFPQGVTVNGINVFELIPGNHALILYNNAAYRVLAVTNDYEKVSGVAKKDIIGKGIFDSFPSNPADEADTGEANLRASFEKVVQDKVQHTLPTQRYDVPTSPGNFAERYWSVTNKPVPDENGTVIYILHSVEEVTHKIKAQRDEETVRNMRQAHQLFMQAPLAIHIFKGPDLVIELANQHTLEIWQKGEEVIGQPLEQVLPELKEQGYLQKLDEVRRTGVNHHAYETPVNLLKNGVSETFFFNFVMQPYFEDHKQDPTGVLVIVSDVTERVLIRQKIEESERYFRQLTDTVPAVIWITDPAGSCNYLNKQWYDFTGQEEHEAEGYGWLDATHPDDKETTGKLFLEANEKQVPFTAVYRLRRSDGSYRWAIDKGSPRFSSNGIYEGMIGTVVDIHDQKLAEEELSWAGQALINSESRLRSLVESAPFPIGVYTGRDMLIELANQSIMDVWGKGNDVVGKHYRDILPELVDQQIFQQLDDVFTTGNPFYADNQRVDLMLDGKLKVFYFNYRFTPLFDEEGEVYGVMNTAADVTSLNVAKQKIEESESNFRRLVMQSPVGICIVGGDPVKAEIMNDSFLAVVGKTRAAFDEAGYWDVLAEAELFFKPKLEEVFKTGRSYNGEETELKLERNGKEETVFVNFVYDPIKDIDGNVTKVMILVIEITAQVIARQKIEEVVTERTKELAQANKLLQQNNQELEQFAYIASHDLQEPLRKVMTFSELLRGKLGDLEPTAQMYFDKIESSSSRMLQLIRDVLNFSQLSKDNDLYTMVNLEKLVENIKNDFELLIEQKKAKIIYEDLPQVEAIPLQMQQLFSNLVSNALKFSREDTVPMIQVSAERLSKKEMEEHPSLKPGLNYFLLRITDNGIGFGQEYSNRIFDIFQRLHGKKAYAGTGIGLALCKKIVQNHHGEIWAKSELGKGATFHVILPEKQVQLFTPDLV